MTQLFFRRLKKITGNNNGDPFLFCTSFRFKNNTSKTKAIWIGAKKFSGETFNHRYKFDWEQNNFTILGIIFSCNLEEMLDLNFKEKLTQIEKKT